MLHYLIKIVDNSFASVVIFTLLFLLLVKVFKGNRKMVVAWGLGLGFAASLVYAILKRNTGFAVREFYDLGVVFVLLAALLLLCLLIWRFIKLDNRKKKKLDLNL